MSGQPRPAASTSSPGQHIHWQSSFNDAEPAQFSSSPGAGPSSPRSGLHHSPLELSTSRTSEMDNAAIDEAIHAKRRKSSLLPGVNIHLPNPLHRKNGKRKGSVGAESHHHHDDHEHDNHEIHESPETLAGDGAEGGQASRGMAIPDIADHRETDEGRELEEELDRLLKEAEEAREPGTAGISLLTGGRARSRDTGEEEEAELPIPGREYVWEVLFENQRGLYAFGKAYFSPGALLPADPSPYTLPIRTLPAASSKFIISNPDGENEIVHSSANKSEPRRRKIDTAYTRETFQLPSPDWEWVDEWSINMRTGTDEMGWRYNAWFRKKGWRSKAGAAGWAGWVRRREWVRLRRLRPGKSDEEEEDTRVEYSEPRRKRDPTLRQVLEDNGDEEALLAIVEQLKSVSLDREKLAMWDRWLHDTDYEAKKRLQGFLDQNQSRKVLYQQFMYRSTSSRFQHLLVERGYSIPETPPTISQKSSRSSSSLPESGNKGSP